MDEELKPTIQSFTALCGQLEYRHPWSYALNILQRAIAIEIAGA
jgi:hypothetical protein